MVHDDALVVGVALVVILVPLGAHFVQALLLVREHHCVHRLEEKRVEEEQFLDFSVVRSCVFPNDVWACRVPVRPNEPPEWSCGARPVLSTANPAAYRYREAASSSKPGFLSDSGSGLLPDFEIFFPVARLLTCRLLPPHLLDRVVHKAEVFRPSHHRPRYKVGLDQLEEGLVQVSHPVPTVVRQHVQE